MTGGAWTLRVLFSHWTRHPMQLATLLIGLMSATALLSGVQAINTQARLSYDRAAASFGGGATAMLVPAHATTVPQSLFSDLRRAGWLVSPVVEGRVRIDGRQIRLIGIEPISLPRGAGPAPSIDQAALQKFLAAEGQTLIAPETAREIAGTEGARLETDAGEPLPPLHLASELSPNLLVMDIAWAQRALRMPDRISRFLLDSAAAGERTPLADVAGDSLDLVDAGAQTDLQRLTASFHLNLTAFGLLSFLVGLFLVHSAIGLAFEQRLPMLRTLRACGVSPRGLLAALVVELVLLALVAGLGGVVSGFFLASALLPDVAASLRGLYGASVSGELGLAPQWWLAGLGMSIAGALLAAAHALVKVFRLPLLASAQPFAWQDAQRRWLRWQAVLACAAFVVAAVCLTLGTSLVAAFAVLGGILLGAALLLPPLLNLLLRAGEGMSRRPVAMWAWADSRQQLSGLSLALMALLLALAVNVGVGTMVGSFERTFNRWLDGRLSSEIYLVAKDPAQAAAIEADLRSRPDVDAVLPSARAETKLSGEQVEVLGLADHATYREFWPLLEFSPDVWDRVRDGTAILISEQLARRLNLHIGDRLRIPSSGEWIATVGGIYADYGNPKGQIIVNVDQLLHRFDNAERTRFGVRIAPAKVAALMAELQARFALGGTSLADQATVKAESRRIFSRTFAITAALNAFTLAVAGTALFTSLLTLGQARLPQLAPLWAIGLTRRRIAGLELLKTMLLALLTALLALPLGIIVAWCLIEVVNVKAFGWRLPLTIFPAQLGQLLIVAMIAALFATLLPTIKLARIKPITLLKIFADER
ncbi:FtsX-like permease family protein [Bradyrhizobium sp. LHD-71]|uniref:ABC transporter permease n=1 Tax=Bradyrhizobium sp. LHD-71 TaxID=3072141 RepID=UPI00280D5325|nr:FtsX-like permease family protein [Bradyrhizobium sp. LHD-71]MDQ8731844.1 FtsX-like permease family protein [Bradyrhizobium sp. LHD-71]